MASIARSCASLWVRQSEALPKVSRSGSVSHTPSSEAMNSASHSGAVTMALPYRTVLVYRKAKSLGVLLRRHARDEAPPCRPGLARRDGSGRACCPFGARARRNLAAALVRAVRQRRHADRRLSRARPAGREPDRARSGQTRPKCADHDRRLLDDARRRDPALLSRHRAAGPRSVPNVRTNRD